MERVQEIWSRGKHGRGQVSRADSSRSACRNSSVDLSRKNRILEEALSGLRREHDDLQRAMFEAAHMQRRLCGPRHIRREPFEFAGEIFPVRDVSGDFISVFDRQTDLFFAVGDIAGKGLSAGMWFTHLVSMIRRQIYRQADLAAAMQAINQDLCQAYLVSPLTSLFLGRLKLQTGAVVYSNAGHPAGLLLRQNGRVEALEDGGPVLGAVPDASFLCGQIILQAGDSLIAYSDGIVECRNALDAEFGAERLLQAARLSHGSSASGTLFSVLGAAEDFAGSQKRDDDMALMVLQRTVTQHSRLVET